MDYNELQKTAPEIPHTIPLEEDTPKFEQQLQIASIEEIKVEREEKRKDADSEHARKRDTYVTIAGLILVLIIIGLYWATFSFMKPNEYSHSFFNLLNSVIMLIIGYIFGTKITKH